jgi:hypothetical protein
MVVVETLMELAINCDKFDLLCSCGSGSAYARSSTESASVVRAVPRGLGSRAPVLLGQFLNEATYDWLHRLNITERVYIAFVVSENILI